MLASQRELWFHCALRVIVVTGSGSVLVAFQVDITDADRAYLDSLPLSSEAKVRVNRFVEQFIANVSDDFRLDPANRLVPDSPYFVVQHILLDQWGDGRVHTLDFHIRDDGAAFGVLLVAYVDHH